MRPEADAGLGLQDACALQVDAFGVRLQGPSSPKPGQASWLPRTERPGSHGGLKARFERETQLADTFWKWPIRSVWVCRTKP